MTTLEGSFSSLITKEFPAGSFQVDMAQPMANAAFYYLEPQARDGFVGWGVMDEVLRTLGAHDGRSCIRYSRLEEQFSSSNPQLLVFCGDSSLTR